jgi:hypothetical protein
MLHVQEDSGSHAPHAVHDRHAGHSVAMFRTRFWLSLVFTIPTVIWVHMLPSALGWELLAIPVRPSSRPCSGRPSSSTAARSSCKGPSAS